MLAVDNDTDNLLARFRIYQAPVRKWSGQNGQVVQA